MWQPISTAPKKDYEDILVTYESNGVRFVHIAFWVGKDCEGDTLPEDESGWWSYVNNSTAQEMLNGWMGRTPTHWMPLFDLPNSDQ